MIFPLRVLGTSGTTTTSRGLAMGPIAVATVIYFVIGYAVIAWLLRYLSRGSFTPFVVYRVVLGLALLALVGSGVLDPT